jgi:hypothetical protein
MEKIALYKCRHKQVERRVTIIARALAITWTFPLRIQSLIAAFIRFAAFSPVRVRSLNVEPKISAKTAVRPADRRQNASGAWTEQRLRKAATVWDCVLRDLCVTAVAKRILHCRIVQRREATPETAAVNARECLPEERPNLGGRPREAVGVFVEVCEQRGGHQQLHYNELLFIR